jgi:hypothetical protein
MKISIENKPPAQFHAAAENQESARRENQDRRLKRTLR